MYTEKYIDYMQFSINPRSAGYFIRDADDIKEKTESRMRGYKRLIVLNDGTQLHSGHNSGSMLIRMTARACRNVFSEMSSSQFVEYALENGAKFSRVDWACTQYVDHDGLMLPLDWLRAFRDGMVSSPLYERGNGLIGSFGVDEDNEITVETAYIGDLKTRARNGVLRSYDAGITMDLERFMIVRTELEEKRERAHKSAKRHAQGASVGSILTHRLKPQSDYIKDMFDAPEIDIELRGKGVPDDDDGKYSSRWHWLIHRVAPALAQAKLDDDLLGRNSNFNQFLRAYRDKYAELVRKIDSN